MQPPPAVNENYSNIPGIFSNSPQAAPAPSPMPRFIEVEHMAHLHSLTNEELGRVTIMELQNVTNDDIDYIFEISSELTSIISLNLTSNDNPGWSDETLTLLNAVSRLTTLITLNLNAMGITDEIAGLTLAALLSHLQSLRYLSLLGNSLGDLGCSAFADALPSLPSLMTLILSSNNIGNTGCTALAAALPSLPSLTTLGLSNNNIGDAGCSDLATALPPSLTMLYLRWNSIGDAGCSALAVALPSLPALTTLDLSNNNIGAAARAAVRAAARAAAPRLDLNL